MTCAHIQAAMDEACAAELALDRARHHVAEALKQDPGLSLVVQQGLRNVRHEWSRAAIPLTVGLMQLADASTIESRGVA